GVVRGSPLWRAPGRPSSSCGRPGQSEARSSREWCGRRGVKLHASAVYRGGAPFGAGLLRLLRLRGLPPPPPTRRTARLASASRATPTRISTSFVLITGKLVICRILPAAEGSADFRRWHQHVVTPDQTSRIRIVHRIVRGVPVQVQSTCDTCWIFREPTTQRGIIIPCPHMVERGLLVVFLLAHSVAHNEASIRRFLTPG